jgi:hypothetical protein
LRCAAAGRRADQLAKMAVEMALVDETELRRRIGDGAARSKQTLWMRIRLANAVDPRQFAQLEGAPKAASQGYR